MDSAHTDPELSQWLRWASERGKTPMFVRTVAGEVFQDATPAMKAYNLRRRRMTFDWIYELTLTLIKIWAVHTQRQADTVQCLAVKIWLQRNGVITITQNKKVLPVFREQFAHN